MSDDTGGRISALTWSLYSLISASSEATSLLMLPVVSICHIAVMIICSNRAVTPRAKMKAKTRALQSDLIL